MVTQSGELLTWICLFYPDFWLSDSHALRCNLQTLGYQISPPPPRCYISTACRDQQLHSLTCLPSSSMTFELRYSHLRPITGLVGIDRQVYWIKRDAQNLLQARLPATRLRAYQVMGMAGEDPAEAATAPAAALYSPCLLYAHILTHAQLCQAFQASDGPVAEFGRALNSRTVYVAYSRLPCPTKPIMQMLQPHQVLRRCLWDTRIRVMRLDSAEPVLWFVWVACFDAWVQEHVYRQRRQ